METYMWFGIAVAVGVGVFCRRRQHAMTKDFKTKFPPISDVEFAALCTPGTRIVVVSGVRRALSDALGVDYYQIHPSARLCEDLGAE